MSASNPSKSGAPRGSNCGISGGEGFSSDDIREKHNMNHKHNCLL